MRSAGLCNCWLFGLKGYVDALQALWECITGWYTQLLVQDLIPGFRVF